MARLAVFVDGGYLAKVSAASRSWVDVGKLASKVRERLGESTFEPLDLIRTYYYDCLPYQGDPPTPRKRIASARRGVSSPRFRVSLDARCGKGG